MGEISLEANTVSKFISSLSKSIQALCHGCMDFDNSIQMIGYININIDSDKFVDCVLNEKVHKSAANSITCVSNSFPAKKEKPKQTKDSSCSPIPHSEFVTQHSSNKRPFSETRGYSYRGSVRKKHRYLPKPTAQSSYEQYSSPANTYYNEQSASDISEFGNQEQMVKSEVPESSTGFDPSASTSSNDYPIKTEVDLSDSQNVGSDQSAVNNEHSKSDATSFVQDSDSNRESTNPVDNANNFSEGDPYNDEQGNSGQFESEDHPETSYYESGNSHNSGAAHGQQSYNDSEEHCADDQFEVIEIGDDDEEMQGFFDQTDFSGSFTTKPAHSYGATGTGTPTVSDGGGIPRVMHLGLSSQSQPSSIQHYDNTTTTTTTTDDNENGNDNYNLYFYNKRCDYCQTFFANRQDLNQHLVEKHKISLSGCHLCNKKFTSDSGLRHHLKTHKRRGFQCQVCDMKFSLKHHLKTHSTRVHRLTLCNNCCVGFACENEYSQHVLQCTKVIYSDYGQD